MYIDGGKYALVIALFCAHHKEYFPSLSFFVDLLHEPLGQ